MKIMRDFLCGKCGTFERFVEADAHVIECDCGGIATRQMGMPTVKLDGTDPSFPDAYERWAKIREDNARIKAKRSH